MKKLLFGLLVLLVLVTPIYCLNTGSSTAVTTSYTEITFPVSGRMVLGYYAIDSTGDLIPFYTADDAAGTNERFIGAIGIAEPINVVDGTVFYVKLLSGIGTFNVFFGSR